MRQRWIFVGFLALLGGCASPQRQEYARVHGSEADRAEIAMQIDPRALDSRPGSLFYGGEGFTELSVQIGRDAWPSTLRDQPDRATGVYYLDYYDYQGRPLGGFGGYGWGNFIQRRVRIHQSQTYSR